MSDKTIARAATSAAAAGNEFIALGGEERISIDQMKLQKLLFYAHAWHLAIKGAALFEEDVEAWPWGPVVRSVYDQTRRCGRAPVTDWLFEIEMEGDDYSQAVFTHPRIEDQETKDFLKAVWDSHKRLSGIQLSNATHLKGEPWTIIKNQYGSLDGKPLIPNALIEKVFKAKIPNGNPKDTAAA
jgi:uncharacterized phage-associated protein